MSQNNIKYRKNIICLIKLNHGNVNLKIIDRVDVGPELYGSCKLYGSCQICTAPVEFSKSISKQKTVANAQY